jgi:ring-1,2-phenylacetyl-CoA epoxidase subunit PaaB
MPRSTDLAPGGAGASPTSIPENAPVPDGQPRADSQWTLWEIFAQGEGGAPHEHVGSLHAPDAEIALQNARDVYARRGPVVSLWVVPSIEITASPSDQAGPFFDPAADKVYRHPQFYKVPRGLKGF